MTLSFHESDRESAAGTPEPAMTLVTGNQPSHSPACQPLLTLNPALQRHRTPSPHAVSPASLHEDRKRSTPETRHVNGTMASMFQNLQTLASMQNMPQMSQQMTQQMSQQMAQLATNLQGLAAMQSNPIINSPLNLSVSGTGPLSSNAMTNNTNHMQPSMPQLVLASGQIGQGIQGAQLLIPTSQGIATQTILTIPVNNMNNDQIVNLALNNGQAISTSMANLQAMSQPHQIMSNSQQATSNTIRNNLMNQAALTNALLNPSLPSFLANGAANAQQLLQAMQQQPQLHTAPGSLLQTVPPMSNCMQGQKAASPCGGRPDQSSQHSQAQRHYKDRENNYLASSQSSSHSSSFLAEMNRERERNMNRERGRERERETVGNLMNGMNGQNSAVAALNSINRLTASNGEITITTSHSSSGGSSGSGGGLGMGMTSPMHMKSSPCSAKLSPTGTDISNDLLADSPSQPTISQATSNMVDGINLDDIKEFAKAFKLRRLGLGLTQTQVGQALSVTEGPAYSQSAICSALASQMLAAQLSSQQQNIFEKLDITPKSAQKIKPVLERWMKEAEERYASGQNHLTDFIGMEPSKKRKRRTSFTPQALELLNAHFERNTHPSGTEITGLAHQLGYEREVIRIWFCNKRQALKNTVRMMSKGMV